MKRTRTHHFNHFQGLCIRLEFCIHNIIISNVFQKSFSSKQLFGFCFSSFGMCSSLCQAQNNSIKTGELLTYSDKLLVSSDGRFQLGFFNLAPYITNSYLGIWLTDYTYRIFWVANRDTPISADDKANITLDTNGLLKIIRSGGEPIALNSDQVAQNLTATLENSGNFVLRELNRDGSVKQVLWESFDHPTDSLLPGMKLGVNIRTGKKWMLTSWLSKEEPASGAYTLEYDDSEDGLGGALVMKFRGEPYWNGSTQGLKDLIIGYRSVTELEKVNYNDRYVSNRNESYYSFSISDGFFSRLVLDPDGLNLNAESLTLSVVLENECQGYSSKPECVKEGTPKCRNRKDTFEKRSGLITLDSVNYNNASISMSISDCWDQCWKDCDCVAFRWVVSTCSFSSKGAVFYPSYDGSQSQTDLYVSNLTFPIKTVEPISKGSDSVKIWIWVVISVVALVVVVSVSVLVCFLKRKKLKEKEEAILNELITSDGFNNKEEIIDFDGNKGRDLKLFSFASVMAATSNFSNGNKLGQGGFGPVFKGTLPEGQEIAVKRLSRSSGQGLVEFKNELILIAKLQHMNLVRLLGCCVRGDVRP